MSRHVDGETRDGNSWWYSCRDGVYINTGPGGINQGYITQIRFSYDGDTNLRHLILFYNPEEDERIDLDME